MSPDRRNIRRTTSAKEKPPRERGGRSYVVVSNGLFLCVGILVLIFPRDRSLTVAFFHAGALVIGLTVLWHDDHLLDSLPEIEKKIRG